MKLSGKNAVVVFENASFLLQYLTESDMFFSGNMNGEHAQEKVKYTKQLINGDILSVTWFENKTRSLVTHTIDLRVMSVNSLVFMTDTKCLLKMSGRITFL
ncbi:hypothetical protein AV955_gp057 [Diadromus pulchellus ascovirus 4a]|uniref:Complete DpAV4 genome n=1 Tax=Diadromus pulchellus ascovirus 4a TaxID=158683 RepID=F2NYY6_9VIRU|nr:hypothetical protein AV955_gp057 [Diadromus pulchellus ascovirus 4a]CCA61414.1 unnamed protein product [Diadromus pulchellus ascovirus 4a]